MTRVDTAPTCVETAASQAQIALELDPLKADVSLAKESSEWEVWEIIVIGARRQRKSPMSASVGGMSATEGHCFYGWLIW